jgi:hypothetical protein
MHCADFHSGKLCHDFPVLRVLVFLLLVPLGAAAQPRLVLMPLDVELFEISAGGVIEPRADWTALAVRHIKEALRARHGQWKDFSDDADPAIAEVLRLHRAVTQALVTHHAGSLKLPTKAGRLDWSLGPDVAPLRKKTGADYALFTWIRDTYASGARKVFGLGLGGGVQSAHASLVDLRSGEIVWFSRVRRLRGDLRESEAALESVEALFAGMPQ